MCDKPFMPESLKVRPASPDDMPHIAHLFHETVHRINVRDYSARQVSAWAPEELDAAFWLERLSTRRTYVAEAGNLVAGFGELCDGGFIDAFYVHSAFQRRGVGKALYGMLERAAREAGAERIRAEVSLTARPFFEAMGLSVIGRQTVTRRGVELDNFIMEKRIVGAA